ncbi:MAG: hypothetical protein IJH39_08860 [Clostridia bacterium]|nr:hypothetical protein [Clostridia bacterium]
MFDFDKKEESILNELFSSREEYIGVITDYDKENINDLVKENDTYEVLLNKIKELSADDKTIKQIKESLESYTDGVHAISSYENEKIL